MFSQISNMQSLQRIIVDISILCVFMNLQLQEAENNTNLIYSGYKQN